MPAVVFSGRGREKGASMIAQFVLHMAHDLRMACREFESGSSQSDQILVGTG